ncbi:MULTISPECIES: hypothetical protein [Undibacterium]|jgi:hypothetical protein|uniref:Uncharacterized protein n=1 Tax=Undibacterium umbellatum TaxID=2762300 RepID=A0ABR6ZGA2_9BURK|nr:MULTISPECIES: hypothetical protein [Undibacterium]MBC3910760.1 hypothetical protein [Undibacterium umbellatum]MDP1977847.1 hypothetical protein [Undibacterium sp.]
MELENACFYLIKDRGSEKIVFTLSDGVKDRLRFIEHMSAGLEESFDTAKSTVIRRIGNATEVWEDEFAAKVLGLLVHDGLELDTLESLQLVQKIRQQSLPLNDLSSIRGMVHQLHEERKEVEASRSNLWHAIAHRSAI